MTTDWDLISNFAVAMLAVVNPIEKIPLWVEASKDGRTRFQWMLAGLIILSSAAVLLAFMWFGRQALQSLRIDLSSFQIGGGLILLRFGFRMLEGRAVDIRPAEGDAAGDLKRRVVERYRQVFIPIGVPVIAGPGAITTVIIYGYQSDTFLTGLLLSLTLGGILTVLFFTLLAGPLVHRVVGDLPLHLTSRVFGMILIAIAVQFVVEGLADVFPGWVSPTGPDG